MIVPHIAARMASGQLMLIIIIFFYAVFSIAIVTRVVTSVIIKHFIFAILTTGAIFRYLTGYHVITLA